MKNKSSIIKIFFKGSILFSLFLFLIIVTTAFASSTDGTIDSTNRYAYSENSGWIDFGTSGGNVHINDSALTGYAYGENIGWISLNCSNTSSCGTVDYKVSNNSEGTLTGYAYGENVGWIQFNPSGAGVTIDSSGVFHGSAYGENIGWITFNCANTSSCGTVNYLLSTDWRPASSRSGPPPTVFTTSVGGGGGGGSNPNPGTPPQFQPANCPPGYVCTLIPNTNPNSNFLNPAIFTRNLTIGSEGADVKALQIYLNTHGFPLATTGVGSPGKETNYFGTLTRAALSKFQKAHGISPSAGYFGPITRAYIKSH